MKDQINNRLTEEGIPVKAAELIQYTDEAGTLKSLETVISTIKELVSDGITERLRGKDPGRAWKISFYRVLGKTGK